MRDAGFGVSRRTFLGTALGTVAGGALAGGPWRAAEAVPVPTMGQTVRQRLLRLHGLGPSMRRRFRAAFACRVDDEERLIWAPGVREVEGWAWHFEGLLATREFTARGLTLVDDQGYVLGSGSFDVAERVNPCDTFTATYALAVPDVHSLRNDCAISPLCERLIVARHLGHIGASAQGAPGRIPGRGR